LFSCAKFAEGGNRALFMKVDEIHDEIIRVDYVDLQVLLKMGHRKIRDVEGENRIRLHRHRRSDHVPIFDMHRFKDRRFRSFELDCGVRERSVHGSGNPPHSQHRIAVEWPFAESFGQIAHPFGANACRPLGIEES
jgi:hypothetical protein